MNFFNLKKYLLVYAVVLVVGNPLHASSNINSKFLIQLDNMENGLNNVQLNQTYIAQVFSVLKEYIVSCLDNAQTDLSQFYKDFNAPYNNKIPNHDSLVEALLNNGCNALQNNTQGKCDAQRMFNCIKIISYINVNKLGNVHCNVNNKLCEKLIDLSADLSELLLPDENKSSKLLLRINDLLQKQNVDHEYYNFFAELISLLVNNSNNNRNENQVLVRMLNQLFVHNFNDNGNKEMFGLLKSGQIVSQYGRTKLLPTSDVNYPSMLDLNKEKLNLDNIIKSLRIDFLISDSEYYCLLGNKILLNEDVCSKITRGIISPSYEINSCGDLSLFFLNAIEQYKEKETNDEEGELNLQNNLITKTSLNNVQNKNSRVLRHMQNTVPPKVTDLQNDDEQLESSFITPEKVVTDDKKDDKTDKYNKFTKFSKWAKDAGYKIVGMQGVDEVASGYPVYNALTEDLSEPNAALFQSKAPVNRFRQMRNHNLNKMYIVLPNKHGTTMGFGQCIGIEDGYDSNTKVVEITCEPL